MDLEQMLHACMIIPLVNPVSQQWMSNCIFIAIHGPFLSIAAIHQICPAHHSTEPAILCYR